MSLLYWYFVRKASRACSPRWGNIFITAAAQPAAAAPEAHRVGDHEREENDQKHEEKTQIPPRESLRSLEYSSLEFRTNGQWLSAEQVAHCISLTGQVALKLEWYQEKERGLSPASLEGCQQSLHVRHETHVFHDFRPDNDLREQRI